MSEAWPLALVSAVIGALVGAFVAPIAKVALPEDRVERLFSHARRPPGRRRLLISIVAGGLLGIGVYTLFLAGGSDSDGEKAKNAGVVAATAVTPENQPPAPRGSTRSSCFNTAHRVSRHQFFSRVIDMQLTAVLAGNNPQPATGRPHGTGISHRDYPTGYKLNGEPRPSFDNYIDYSNCAPNDERPFVGARVLAPHASPRGSFETRRKIRVRPGDEVSVSVYIHNNGATSGNGGGKTAIARNTRIGVRLPHDARAELQVAVWLYADNAVVQESDLALHSISDNISILSQNGVPIELSWEGGSARLLQSSVS